MPSARTNQEPTAAENQLFDVNDVFYRLLDRHPQEAAALAAELALVAERFQRRRIGRWAALDIPGYRPQPNTGSDEAT